MVNYLEMRPFLDAWNLLMKLEDSTSIKRVWNSYISFLQETCKEIWCIIARKLLGNIQTDFLRGFLVTNV